MDSVPNEKRLYDVVIIGGGISGLGVALEASRAGFDTLLLEKNQICKATSDNSLRIIHGGFRYLQSLDLMRVVESLRDQTDAMREAPNLITRLPCILPLRRFGLRSRIPVSIAAFGYNSLSKMLTGTPNQCKVVEKSFVDKAVPALEGFAPYGALLWHDALLRDPEKFAALITHKIDREGGEILEGVSALSVTRSDGRFSVLCKNGAGDFSVRSRIVVNAAGPWLNGIRTPEGHAPYPKAWVRGFNIVLSRSIEEKFAIGIEARKRNLFIVPRGKTSVVGTEYLSANSDPLDPRVSDEEAALFLREFSKALPNLKITESDIQSLEAGILPARSATGVKLYGLSRIHSQSGLIEILSTKYTTFRSQARRALRLGLPHLRN